MVAEDSVVGEQRASGVPKEEFCANQVLVRHEKSHK